ncbi:MAG: anthranilate phosphoribosyltransferase [Nanoarchaeota archaeon]|nr:anthranilate phosphoribosyltransferase [Nanoarchaeota archaeon]
MEKFIEKIKNGKDLSRDEASNAILSMLEEAKDNEIYGFLVAMNEKKPTIEELVGFVRGMKEKAISIKPNRYPLVDLCGTGGDNANTYNISTLAAFIVASAGIAVAKHGNKAITSNCGSADVLTALGVKIDLEPKQVEQCINDVGFGYMFAPIFHPAMKRVADIRKRIKEERGEKTIFNLLGPLGNPANANRQLIGVYEESLCEKSCYVLKEIRTKHALVVHGSGLDEISNIGKTTVYELKDNIIKHYQIEPEDFGFERYKLKDISGGTPEENAKIILDIVNGKEKGAKRDIAVLNASFAIYAAGGAKNIKRAIKKAEYLIESGATAKKLDEIANYYRGMR